MYVGRVGSNSRDSVSYSNISETFMSRLGLDAVVVRSFLEKEIWIDMYRSHARESVEKNMALSLPYRYEAFAL